MIQAAAFTPAYRGIKPLLQLTDTPLSAAIRAIYGKFLWEQLDGAGFTLHLVRFPPGKSDIAEPATGTHLGFMPSTTYRYLIRLPGVCAGRMIIEGTRIGVHDVVGLIVNGASVDDVCRSFPDLKRSQVYECLAYYEDHRGEIDALVAEQMAEDLR